MYPAVGRIRAIEREPRGESERRLRRLLVRDEAGGTGTSSVFLRNSALAEHARRALKQKDFRFSRCVRCDCDGGLVVLSGRVPSYYLKQLAQVAVATVDGVEQIENRIDVFVPEAASSGRP